MLISFCNSLLRNLEWLSGLFIIFTVLTLIFHRTSTQPIFRKDALGDIIYFLFSFIYTGLFYKLFWMIGLVILTVAGRWDDRAVSAFIRDGGWIGTWPQWLQTILFLFISDFLMYWLHRSFHWGILWHFHAIHHSAKEVDWLTTARVHPVNLIYYSTLATVITLLLGFAPGVFLSLTAFNYIYSALVHADLTWTFGPLKKVLVSPVYHRWHHADHKEAFNKNFAPTFPILDIIFGTYYMPDNKIPCKFGLKNEVPEGFWSQLIYPLKRIADSCKVKL